MIEPLNPAENVQRPTSNFERSTLSVGRWTFLTRFIALLILLTLPGGLGAADSEAKPSVTAPRAARSVHLRYSAPASTLFYNEVTVEESTSSTYFCACGFNQGYFGIQELRPGREKVVIFSVWDPGKQNDPTSVDPEKRVEI